jgi:ureidoglycolate lyase
VREITPQALTAEAFAPFGEVIEASGRTEQIAINYGQTTRFNDLARIDVEGGHAIVSIFRGQPLEPPLLKIFERHPLGSQSFTPLNGRAFLVAVAPPGDFDPAAIRVFYAAPHQGVNYAKGVWHHYLLPMGGEGDFLVIDRAGPGDNLDEVDLAEPDQILVRL